MLRQMAHDFGDYYLVMSRLFSPPRIFLARRIATMISAEASMGRRAFMPLARSASLCYAPLLAAWP